MALTTFKCNYLTPLHFKWLIFSLVSYRQTKPPNQAYITVLSSSTSTGLLCSRFMAFSFCSKPFILLNLLLPFLLQDTLLTMQSLSQCSLFLPWNALPFILPSIISCNKTISKHVPHHILSMFTCPKHTLLIQYHTVSS